MRSCQASEKGDFNELASFAIPSESLENKLTGSWLLFWQTFSKKTWPELESNQRHKDFQSSALPTELSGQNGYEERKGFFILCAAQHIAQSVIAQLDSCAMRD